MTEKPNRRWLQIHLSTAIVLMFVAGGLLWANITPYHSKAMPHFVFRVSLQKGTYLEVDIEDYGFPLSYRKEELGYRKGKSIEIETQYSNLAVNFLTSIVSLIAVALLSEWHFRREAPKQ